MRACHGVRAWIDAADMYTMPIGEGYVGTTSGARVEVVVGTLSFSTLICGGPSVSGAVIVEDDGGSDSGIMANNSGKWTGGCGAHRRATRFSLAFIRLASSVLCSSIIVSR